jgi:hypothetical protein
MLVQHALSLDRAFTPRLDSLNHALPAFRQTMSMHVIQAVYGGRVKLVQLLYDESLERARQGTGVAFNLRDVFFPSKITLLHMVRRAQQADTQTERTSKQRRRGIHWWNACVCVYICV